MACPGDTERPAPAIDPPGATERSAVERLDEFPPDRPPLCPNCGYNLTALTRAICPECGQPFAIVDEVVEVRSFTRGQMWWRLLWPAGICYIATMLPTINFVGVVFLGLFVIWYSIISAMELAVWRAEEQLREGQITPSAARRAKVLWWI